MYPKDLNLPKKTCISNTTHAEKSQDMSKSLITKIDPISTQNRPNIYPQDLNLPKKTWIWDTIPAQNRSPDMSKETCNDQNRPICTHKRSESTKKDTTPAQNRPEDMSKETFIHDTFYQQFPLKMLHPRHSPNRETQIPRYLAVQHHKEIWV